MIEPTALASEPPKRVPLDALHRQAGARMVPFAGYEMPLQYPAGILTEHLHCRQKAALFDVSHMGQVVLRGDGAAAALERIVPGDIVGLAQRQQRYTMLINDAGGIVDDVMVANYGDRLLMIVNAARKTHDLAYLRDSLRNVGIEYHESRAILALQGPQAAQVLARIWPQASSLRFMRVADAQIGGVPCWVSRSGYTGEDGYELCVPGEGAERVARLLLDQPEVAWAGLGARDSLRLDAGLPLYGSDLDEQTTPIEAGLAWTIGPRRRAAWDFPGAATIRAQIEHGPPRSRVGLRPDARAPARAGTAILSAQGAPIGNVTSGGFSPSLKAPVAMGYVGRDHSGPDTHVGLSVRGKLLPAHVVPLPFVAHHYIR